MMAFLIYSCIFSRTVIEFLICIEHSDILASVRGTIFFISSYLLVKLWISIVQFIREIVISFESLQVIYS